MRTPGYSCARLRRRNIAERCCCGRRRRGRQRSEYSGFRIRRRTMFPYFAIPLPPGTNDASSFAAIRFRLQRVQRLCVPTFADLDGERSDERRDADRVVERSATDQVGVFRNTSTSLRRSTRRPSPLESITPAGDGPQKIAAGDLSTVMADLSFVRRESIAGSTVSVFKNNRCLGVRINASSDCGQSGFHDGIGARRRSAFGAPGRRRKARSWLLPTSGSNSLSSFPAIKAISKPSACRGPPPYLQELWRSSWIPHRPRSADGSYTLNGITLTLSDLSTHQPRIISGDLELRLYLKYRRNLRHW